MGLNVFLAAFTVSVVSIYYYVFRKKSNKEIEKFQNVCAKFNYADQSEIYVDNNAETRVSKEILRNEKKEVVYSTYYRETCRTLNDVLPQGASLSTSGLCVGKINTKRTDLDWLTFEEVLKRTKHFADGLLQLGLWPKDAFGIYSMNSPEYSIAEYGCYRHSIIVIPIYETLGPNVCAFISKQAKLSTIFCDTLNRVENILKSVKQFEDLKHIIVATDSYSVDQFEKIKHKVESQGLTLNSIEEVESLGASNPKPDNPPNEQDLAVICYTSGTTDAPKGVMLTHQNVVANFSSIMHHLAGMLAAGGKVGYFSGDIKRLSDDMKLIKPTMFPCVPRVLNKIYGKIFENVNSSAVKSWLLNTAYNSKRKQLENKIFDNHTFWDYLIFNKIRALLGGHVRLIPVGSAPINGKVLDFLRCALGCHILEGYGQTECVSACTVTLIGDFTTGHVGVPLNAVSIKLIDVPQMGYFVSEGKGEVVVKGSIVFKGYYKDENKTREVLDEDGWLHTGDIGMFTPSGTLQIVDRKKDIFKLAQGEYIAPAKIEDIYAQSPYILQIFVYGDSYKSCLVGIVVPNLVLIQESFKKLGKGQEIDFNNNDQLRNSKAIKEFLFDELANVGKISKLKSFEKIKDIYIYPEGFTIEAELVTPTLKNKRFALKNFFKKEIDELYSRLD